MSAHARTVTTYLERNGWTVEAETSSATYWRRPDRQLGAARTAYVPTSGPVELRRGNGRVLKTITADASAVIERDLGKALARTR